MTAPDPVSAAPRLVLHVGMGKTGTSAIQLALMESRDVLRAQRAAYLGANLAVPGQPKGWDGMAWLIARPVDELARHGAELAARLHGIAAGQGVDTFILSNEALSGLGAKLAPFFAAIAARMPLTVLAWARDPVGWLPSAHAQWAVRHKVAEGPIEPMAVAGRKLINYYRGLVDWQETMPQAFHLRPYRRGTDIVAEFAEAAGLTLPQRPQSVYSRPAPAELLLRAMFNDLRPGETLPVEFDRALRVGSSLRQVPDLREMTRRVLDYGDTSAIVAENAELFDQITAATGLELRGMGGESVPEVPATGQLRGALIEHLAAIVLDQAQRIERLEAALTRSESRLAAIEDAGAPRQTAPRRPGG